MAVLIINPKNKLPLHSNGNFLIDSEENSFPIISGVPRIAELENYTANFGKQWNKFDKTQLDREIDGQTLSKDRFFAETQWDQEDLTGKNVLEVGSGAGRFSKVMLEYTEGTLYSIDFSDAVSANFRNNHSLAPDRFHLFQASIYDMPFPDNSFDKVFCFGVLQHTPDFESSVKALIDKAKPGAEVVVDFYPIKGWWTKIHAKYILRPITKKIPHDRLFSVIEKNIDWLIACHLLLHKIGLGLMTRFLPICNVKESFPKALTKAEIREWAVLDTFDQYSPEHDHPQRLTDVIRMFEKYGATVSWAGPVFYMDGNSTVVRGIKK
jgi:ubiquinone/menaquinone biosynthesis C-methylase UbiE